MGIYGNYRPTAYGRSPRGRRKRRVCGDKAWAYENFSCTLQGGDHETASI